MLLQSGCNEVDGVDELNCPENVIRKSYETNEIGVAYGEVQTEAYSFVSIQVNELL